FACCGGLISQGEGLLFQHFSKVFLVPQVYVHAFGSLGNGAAETAGGSEDGFVAMVGLGKAAQLVQGIDGYLLFPILDLDIGADSAPDSNEISAEYTLVNHLFYAEILAVEKLQDVIGQLGRQVGQGRSLLDAAGEPGVGVLHRL